MKNRLSHNKNMVKVS